MYRVAGTMSYSDTSLVNYASMGAWYDILELASFLRTAENSAFSVQTVRDGLRDTFNSLPTAPPFSLSVRFPTDSLYVSPFKANWNQLIVQMTTALAYKPGAKDTKNKTVDTSDGLDTNDVTQAFFQSIKAMKELLMQPPPNDAIFNQSNFESFFRLTWA